MVKKTEDPFKNDPLVVAFAILVAAIVFVLMFLSCTKEPIFDPDCGVISAKVAVNDTWITTYKWNDGETETIIWHFDPVSKVGDTICKLQNIDLNELNCKP